MKSLHLTLVLALFTLLFTQCKKENLMDGFPGETDTKSAVGPPSGNFTVTIENVSIPYDYFAAGAKYVPDGLNSAGPAHPGQSFTIEFHAGKGHWLSFASMYGASNDLFYAPSDEGIKLFDGSTPLTGNITDQVSLWDAGTEVNHAPGSGIDGAMESEPVRSVRNIDNVGDGFAYNNVEENIQVMLDYDGTSTFTLTIHVLNTSGTPLSPVAWVVHKANQNPVFEEGAPDYGHGLESLAETGNAALLESYLKMHSGYVSPIAPGVWVVHRKGQRPVFSEGKPDYGQGLEWLAEVGDPSSVYHSLMDDYNSGVYNIPVGEENPAPIFPGESYTFSFDAQVGEYLSFASMLGASNDLFFAPDDKGIQLFTGKNTIEGDITELIKLWDAGTEPNEYPGAGIHQGSGGTDENGDVMLVDDGFTYPDVDQMIMIKIMKN